MTSFPNYPLNWVPSRDDLRHLFNTLYWPRIETGEVRIIVVKDRHLGSFKNEPQCTRSQYVEFRDSAQTVIGGAHRYLRPDGKLGGSGRPDPKWLLIDNQIFYYSPRKK